MFLFLSQHVKHLDVWLNLFSVCHFQKENLHAENEELKHRLELSSERLNSQTDETDKLVKALNVRTDSLQQELNEARRLLEMYIHTFE